MTAWSIVASMFTALAVVVLAEWLRTGRDDHSRKMKAFAEALETVTGYQEFPFMVRRRRATDPEGERIRLSSELASVQQRLSFHTAWIELESAEVGEAFRSLVAETKSVAGGEISKAWDAEPITEDKQMHVDGSWLAELEAPKKDYLNAVKSHLGKRMWLFRK